MANATGKVTKCLQRTHLRFIGLCLAGSGVDTDVVLDSLSRLRDIRRILALEPGDRNVGGDPAAVEAIRFDGDIAGRTFGYGDLIEDDGVVREYGPSGRVESWLCLCHVAYSVSWRIRRYGVRVSVPMCVGVSG